MADKNHPNVPEVQGTNLLVDLEKGIFRPKEPAAPAAPPAPKTAAPPLPTGRSAATARAPVEEHLTLVEHAEAVEGTALTKFIGVSLIVYIIYIYIYIYIYMCVCVCVGVFIVLLCSFWLILPWNRRW